MLAVVSVSLRVKPVIDVERTLKMVTTVPVDGAELNVTAPALAVPAVTDVV